MARKPRKQWVSILILILVVVIWYGIREGWFDPVFDAIDEFLGENTKQTVQVDDESKPVSGSGGVTIPGSEKTHNNKNLALGTPLDATPEDEHLMLKPQYAVGYKAEIVSPAWVSWQIEASDYGNLPRHTGRFTIDRTIPEGLPRATHDDYNNTGFDRGHLCRSLDRTDTEENNKATFLMSNIIPQTHDLNGGPWLKLEDYCANLARYSNKVLYIVAGGGYKPGYDTIGKNEVAVPYSSWKAVAILDKGLNPGKITSTNGIRMIAVEMPNDRGIIRNDWRQYQISVDKLEEITGFDFFGNIPLEIQADLEAKVKKF